MLTSPISFVSLNRMSLAQLQAERTRLLTNKAKAGQQKRKALVAAVDAWIAKRKRSK